MFFLIYANKYQLSKKVSHVCNVATSDKCVISNTAASAGPVCVELECGGEKHHWPVFDSESGMWHMDEQQIASRPPPPVSSTEQKYQTFASSFFSNFTFCSLFSVVDDNK